MIRFAALGAGVILVAACTGPSPSASAAGSQFEVTDEVTEIGCGDPVVLRGQDGQQVNLTGLWSGKGEPGPSWNIRQVGSCLFVADLSNSDAPGYYQEICDGTIGGDFVVTARCIDFLQGGVGQPDMGREYFLIRFDDEGGLELVRCLDAETPATCEAPLVPWQPPT